jgi:hypothetical protein
MVISRKTALGVGVSVGRAVGEDPLAYAIGADRVDDARLGQSLGVSDGRVLDAAITVMGQTRPLVATGKDGDLLSTRHTEQSARGIGILRQRAKASQIERERGVCAG